jgi:hypothetical protein
MIVKKFNKLEVGIAQVIGFHFSAKYNGFDGTLNLMAFQRFGAQI